VVFSLLVRAPGLGAGSIGPVTPVQRYNKGNEMTLHNRSWFTMNSVRELHMAIYLGVPSGGSGQDKNTFKVNLLIHYSNKF